MHELTQQLMTQASLTEDQATKAIEIMKSFVLSKVPPMFSGVVEGFFAGGSPEGPDPLSL